MLARDLFRTSQICNILTLALQGCQPLCGPSPTIGQPFNLKSSGDTLIIHKMRHLCMKVPIAPGGVGRAGFSGLAVSSRPTTGPRVESRSIRHAINIPAAESTTVCIRPWQPDEAQPHDGQPHEVQPHEAQPHDGQPHDSRPQGSPALGTGHWVGSRQVVAPAQ